MDITKYEVRMTRHAFVRAKERKISPQTLEAVLKGGTLFRIGKNYLKFIKQYKKYSIICICQMETDVIKVLTIEVKK